MAISFLTTLADTYYADPYSTTYSSSNDPTTNVISLVVAVLMVVALWKIFTKAKQPGWAAIVPIYNAYILLKIVNRPGWWLILYFIPFVNFIIWIIVSNDLAKTFGKGMGTTILLVILPFIGYPMLGFGDAKYTAPKVAK